MQPILLSYETPFEEKAKKNTGPVSYMQLNGSLEAKKYKFSYLLCAIPLTFTFTLPLTCPLYDLDIDFTVNLPFR